MTTTPEDLRNDIAALQAALVEERVKRIEEAARAARVEAELAVAKAKASDDQAVIAHQQLQIAKLTRQLYGQRSERTVRLLDQMELAFEELELFHALTKVRRLESRARIATGLFEFPQDVGDGRDPEHGISECLRLELA